MVCVKLSVIVTSLLVDTVKVCVDVIVSSVFVRTDEKDVLVECVRFRVNVRCWVGVSPVMEDVDEADVFALLLDRVLELGCENDLVAEISSERDQVSVVLTE